MFQVGISSTRKFIPQGSEIHWVLYHLMVVRKLHKHKNITIKLRNIFTHVLEVNASATFFFFLRTNLIWVHWLRKHTISVLPDINKFKTHLSKLKTQKLHQSNQKYNLGNCKTHFWSLSMMNSNSFLSGKGVEGPESNWPPAHNHTHNHQIKTKRAPFFPFLSKRVSDY